VYDGRCEKMFVGGHLSLNIAFKQSFFTEKRR